jgi:hypothetical protein
VTPYQEFEWQFGGKTVLAGLRVKKQLMVVSKITFEVWSLFWFFSIASGDFYFSGPVRPTRLSRRQSQIVAHKWWSLFRRLISINSRYGVRNLVGIWNYAYFRYCWKASPFLECWPRTILIESFPLQYTCVTRALSHYPTYPLVRCPQHNLAWPGLGCYTFLLPLIQAYEFMF